MSATTSAQRQQRFLHEAVYFDSADELVGTTAPLLQQALDEGADVALGCTDSNNRALLDALGHDDRVLVLPRSQIYEKAVTAVGFFRDFVEERIAGGAPGVCVLGEVDFGTDDRALTEWRRYESLLNHALSRFPLWSLCGYDTRLLGDPVIATSELTHPFVRRGAVQAPNPALVDPADLLRLADADGDSDAGSAHGIEPTVTIPEVVDLGELRLEVRAFLGERRMGHDLADDLLTAVNEVVINGLRHGQPPVTVRLWALEGRVECAVTDRGSGVDDPFVGYVRGGGEELPEGGFGLWLARRLCDEVVLRQTPEGFTTRLVVNH